ncbi:BrnT family toxin [Photobacterium andalusiense]|uniref:BrnT family toxin n=1 Tax=Photobacterium andalusiense TaxID=2204296 RepID=UPI000B408C54|nr:BrnT family toxin [Photobacterium andalusiense]
MQYNYKLSNPNKAKTNTRKHGVTFVEAESVFSDECARIIPDPDSSYGEERFIIMGLSENHNTLVVCHCYRGDDERIRIISARKAEKRERKQYEEFRYA